MCRSSLLACLMFCLFLPRPASAKDYIVFYLGGQSNMDGYGRIAELPDQLNSVMHEVPIFHGNTSPDNTAVDGRGIWSKLRAGHGVGFQSDGTKNTYSDRFGVELTFAHRLREKLANKNIALIKYSRGGTSIDQRAAGGFGCWDPDYNQGEGPGRGVNQYDHFLATVRRATEVVDIDGDGESDRLIAGGIIWMQGESDAAYGPEVAGQYQENLKRLIDLVRAALRTDDLPVAIGRISDSGRDQQDGQVWDHGNVVRAQQAAFVDNDQAARLVTSTDQYGYSDPWHYDSAGYLDLGEKFADALLEQIQAGD